MSYQVLLTLALTLHLYRHYSLVASVFAVIEIL